ncbi:hypothetical protein QVD99_005194 [Batrachochytrium dendrobatidis]|nr:hypothetical protein QVD99_005194 [Batrachochytrium dendrobatidis]
MGQGKSANTVPNQIAGLNQKNQKTFDDMTQRLVESKKIRKEKLKEYHESMALGYRKWSLLSMGKEIHGSKHDSEVQKQLKEDYINASKKVNSIRHKLKRFMKRYGLRFEEPKADSD